MQTIVLKQPDIEPISLDEAKNYLQIDHNCDDHVLSNIIQSAREYVEQFINKAFITQTRQIVITAQAGRKKRYFLGSAPFLHLVSSVTLNDKPFTNYHLITGIGQAMLCLHAPLHENDLMKVTFTCGFGDKPENVPAIFKQAILIKISEMYNHRSGAAFSSRSYLKDLLASYQMLRLA